MVLPTLTGHGAELTSAQRGQAHERGPPNTWRCCGGKDLVSCGTASISIRRPEIQSADDGGRTGKRPGVLGVDVINGLTAGFGAGSIRSAIVHIRHHPFLTFYIFLILPHNTNLLPRRL
ncbi:unnamed protein product [Somion occarium]|uniref:Uncharacterized protein n=1 Tax=Somion occarium TaxID=3059160 RepID=A0ABP1CNM8_9APHY